MLVGYSYQHLHPVKNLRTEDVGIVACGSKKDPNKSDTVRKSAEKQKKKKVEGG